jgi:uncharacterized RDD family membrane protein YckC
METWYIVIEGKPAGPYTFEELKDLPVKPDTFLKTSGMDDYKEAHELPEVRELLGFKHRVALPQYFATLDTRLLAFAIDYLLIIAPCSFLSMVLVMFTSSSFFKGIILVAGLILVFVSKFIYACIMEASSRQATFGKSWLGIKVCDENGLRLSFSGSFLRNAAKLLSVFTMGIGYMIGFFDKRQQCLHDRIAGTLVIKDRLI